MPSTSSFNPGTDPSRPFTPDDQDREIRFGVISEWIDGSEMTDADLSAELAGRRVMPFAAADGGVVEYSQSMGVSIHSGVPGFLFSGDDGESLWFWPESQDLAFRLEAQAREILRSSFSEYVARLLCQGALVFCHKLETVSSHGAPLFEFLPAVQLAA